MATSAEPRKGITDEQQQELDECFSRARKALAIIETYDQARVDRLCQAVAWAVANKSTFARLVDMGIEESGLGDPDSRMGKRMKIRGVLREGVDGRIELPPALDLHLPRFTVEAWAYAEGRTERLHALVERDGSGDVSVIHWVM